MKAAVMLSILACALGVPQMSMKTSSPMEAAGEGSVGLSLMGTTQPSSVSRLGLPAGGPSASSVNRQGFGGGRGSRFHSGGSFPQQRNWGPTAYGPGLNNRWAFPPNPFVMERAIALTKRVPNTLVRVDVNGEVQITDRHGLEVEIVDWFGNDVTEGLEEFEEGPFGFPGMGFGNGFGNDFGNGFGNSFGNEFGRGFGNSGRGGFGNTGRGGVGIGLNGF